MVWFNFLLSLSLRLRSPSREFYLCARVNARCDPFFAISGVVVAAVSHGFLTFFRATCGLALFQFMGSLLLLRWFCLSRAFHASITVVSHAIVWQETLSNSAGCKECVRTVQLAAWNERGTLLVEKTTEPSRTCARESVLLP